MLTVSGVRRVELRTCVRLMYTCTCAWVRNIWAHFLISFNFDLKCYTCVLIAVHFFYKMSDNSKTKVILDRYRKNLKTKNKTNIYQDLTY